jgi:hypothetical protein
MCGIQFPNVENFSEKGVQERLERHDAKRRWEPGSGDWGLLAYSLISMFTIKVTQLSRLFSPASIGALLACHEP